MMSLSGNEPAWQRVLDHVRQLGKLSRSLQPSNGKSSVPVEEWAHCRYLDLQSKLSSMQNSFITKLQEIIIVGRVYDLTLNNNFNSDHSAKALISYSSSLPMIANLASVTSEAENLLTLGHCSKTMTKWSCIDLSYCCTKIQSAPVCLYFSGQNSGFWQTISCR